MDPNEFEQKQKEVNRMVLERAASDAQFRQQLIDNPEQALQSAGLASQIDELQAATAGSEVQGQAFTIIRVCIWFTRYRRCLLEGETA